MLKSEKRIFSHEHDFFLLFNAIFFKTKLQESFGIGILVHTAQGHFYGTRNTKYADYRKAYLYRKEIDRCNIRIKAMKD